MRKLLLLAVGLVIALGLSLTAVGVTPGGEATAQAQAGGITIDQFQYNPAELAAKAGQAVTITNNDDMPHTVTAKDGCIRRDRAGQGQCVGDRAEGGLVPVHVHAPSRPAQPGVDQRLLTDPAKSLKRRGGSEAAPSARPDRTLAHG